MRRRGGNVESVIVPSKNNVTINEMHMLLVGMYGARCLVRELEVLDAVVANIDAAGAMPRGTPRRCLCHG